MGKYEGDSDLKGHTTDTPNVRWGDLKNKVPVVIVGVTESTLSMFQTPSRLLSLMEQIGKSVKDFWMHFKQQKLKFPKVQLLNALRHCQNKEK